MKTIESPVKKFPGTVVLPDYLNVPQVRMIEGSLLTNEQLQEIIDSGVKTYWISTDIERRLPAVLAVVKEWHIAGVPEHPSVETFPATPVKASADLIEWIHGEIMLIYRGETTIPNE